MSVTSRIAMVAGGLVLASLSSAQNVTGGLSYTNVTSSGYTYSTGANQACAASADSNNPSASSSLSYTMKLLFEFNSTNMNPTLPTSVSASYKETISGSYTYVIFGSTTPKGAVSAKYAAETDEGAASVQDDSGTIGQTGTEQSKDSTPKTIVGGTSGTVTVSTPSSGWARTDNDDGTYTFTFVWVTNDVSGSASASATGWTPPPPPPGTQNEALYDFSAQGQWYDNLDNYTVNNQVQFQSDPPSPPTGGGGGGGSVLHGPSLITTPWVLRFLGGPCYR